MKFRIERTPAELFSKRLSRIGFIQAIAKDLDNHDVNRKEVKKQYLYESYIVYLVAKWQTFVAHLAEESFSQLIVIESNHMLRGILRNNFYQTLKRFNTPNTQNIDALIEAATGITKVSDNWHWNEVPNETAKSKLAEILKIRHEVAHKANASKPLTLEGNFEYTDFLIKLSAILNKVIDNHIEIELRSRDSA